MTLFYGEELNSNYIENPIRVKKNLVVRHIRAHLYRENIMSNGGIELSIWQGSTELDKYEIDHTELNAATSSTYIHGWFRFDMDTALHHDFENEYTDYIIKVRAVNYIPNTDKVWLVTDLNNPAITLIDSVSEYSRGLEIYTTDQY